MHFFTFSHLCFPFGIWSAVHASLNDVVLDLELVLEFIFELAHALILVLVDVHGLWTVTSLQRDVGVVVCCPFRHDDLKFVC
jgi:hypothetical protein